MVRAKDPFKRAVPPPSSDDPDVPETGTVWHVGELADAITEFNRLTAENKRLKTQIVEVQEKLESYADLQFVRHWAEHDRQPDVPVRLVNAKTGEYCTFVVADKTKTTYVPAKMEAALAEVIGGDAVEANLVETIDYSFNAGLLAKTVKSPETGRPRTLMRLIADKIGPLLDALVTFGQLTQKEADSLLVATPAKAFDRDFVPALPELCGREPSRLHAAITSLGSAFVRFVKPS